MTPSIASGSPKQETSASRRIDEFISHWQAKRKEECLVEVMEEASQNIFQYDGMRLRSNAIGEPLTEAVSRARAGLDIPEDEDYRVFESDGRQIQEPSGVVRAGWKFVFGPEEQESEVQAEEEPVLDDQELTERNIDEVLPRKRPEDSLDHKDPVPECEDPVVCITWKHLGRMYRLREGHDACEFHTGMRWMETVGQLHPGDICSDEQREVIDQWILRGQSSTEPAQ
jgi:hypothetical protein